jgi:hypothetical protein
MADPFPRKEKPDSRTEKEGMALLNEQGFSHVCRLAVVDAFERLSVNRGSKGRGRQALKNDGFDRIHPTRVGVKTWNQCKFLAARFKETFPAADTKFLDRFEAIRHERGRHYDNAFFAFLREAGQFEVGERL